MEPAKDIRRGPRALFHFVASVNFRRRVEEEAEGAARIFGETFRPFRTVTSGIPATVIITPRKTSRLFGAGDRRETVFWLQRSVTAAKTFMVALALP